ncbi:MAG: DNA-3-methyladenine glycosylase I [Spirochaetia bacterium]|jgi:DNA-3-methyladenine glycosylase I|nr:DNA-3-methyladenine glycosylase I [Spirochaetia bacterium]
MTISEFSSYCEYCAAAPEGDLNRSYHDAEYGFPLQEDSALFCRLVLEINQAGLSWLTILKKKDAFVRAYDRFDIDTVAAYKEADTERLLSDSGIIRNHRKIAAAIENARRLVVVRTEFGSFKSWLDEHHPLSKDEWLVLFKKTFVFVGGEIVGEFLMSTGYLPGAHVAGCPSGTRAIAAGAPWAKTSQTGS